MQSIKSHLPFHGRHCHRCSFVLSPPLPGVDQFYFLYRRHLTAFLCLSLLILGIASSSRLNAILLDLSGSLYFWAGVCLGGIFVSSYSFAAVYCLQTCQSSKTQSCSRHRCFFVFFNLHLFDQRINDFSRPDHGYPQGDNSRKSEHLWHFSKHFMDGCWVMRSAKTRVGGTIEF